MGKENSIINIGDWSKPVTVLIEKISKGFGIAFEPRRIVRAAKANATAAVIEAATKIEISDLQQRALERFVTVEGKKQENMEAIVIKALPQVEPTAKPEEVSDDWFAYFFDKCQITSDRQIREIWARILAGEANIPGSFSKRTINFLASLDKENAELFTTLCGSVCSYNGPMPLIYDTKTADLKWQGIGFHDLLHLNAMGLICFQPLGHYTVSVDDKNMRIEYFDSWVNFEFKVKGSVVHTGHVTLSDIGRQLCSICGAKPIPNFWPKTLPKLRALMSQQAAVTASFDIKKI